MEKIRVQKLIADSGYCSRRKAEELIENKQVKVNGMLVSLGDKALPKDDIIVSGEHLYINRKKQYTYIMLHKPRGYVVRSDVWMLIRRDCCCLPMTEILQTT